MNPLLILAACALLSGATSANDPIRTVSSLDQATRTEGAGQGTSTSPLLASLTTIYADGDKEVSWG
ncbi:MAG TPA: hypothetical protein ENJ09_14555, partial [Planctomycetes bacterium]|nr:hypothetical protein [Planctomycetota bacterium]